jgi:RNA polymerase sigma factor (sigma-70 family)
MQRMTVNELRGFRNEFEMTCAAQDGDKGAWMSLWNHYQDMMMSRLIAAKGFTKEELESEALEVFANKLRLFNRGKVKSEAAFSMLSWLFCGVVNRTNQLIRQRKREVHLYFEEVNASFSGEGFLPAGEEDETQQTQMVGVDEGIYTTYNPERLVVERLHDSDTERVKAFYARLTQFERAVLDARREGLTLSQVAKKLACSVTTVKVHIQRAKQYASDIFEVCYA